MTTEVGFYQLSRWPLERALPRLLERAAAQGLRCVVRFSSAERLAQINAYLWTYDADSFLAHGGPEDGHTSEQPVYLTCVEENPNAATVLLLAEGAGAGDRDAYDRCLDLFNGTEAHALTAARARWKALKEAGYPLAYWAQTDDGRWDKRADAINN
jgi:DNA polymerase-3 subunit chi